MSDIVRYLIAAVLFTAALLKAHQLASGPLPPVINDSVLTPLWHLFNNRLLLLAVVEVELFWAFFLFFTQWNRLTYFLTLFCFSVFAAVSALKGLGGEHSCGCFGAVTVNPWLTAAFDIMLAVFLLLFCRPLTGCLSLLPKYNRLKTVLILWFVLSVPVCGAVLSLQIRMHASLGKEFVSYSGRKSIQLRPASWKGREFPLAAYFVPPPDENMLRQNKWTVVLIHAECPRCRLLLEKMKGADNTVAVLVPEIPPKPVPVVSFPLFQLNASYEWNVDTPYLIYLNDNICTGVQEPLAP